MCHCTSQRSRLDGWFADVGRDELGKCGDIDFFFLGFGDDNVGIRGVSSSFASEFELRIWYFIFVGGSI